MPTQKKIPQQSLGDIIIYTTELVDVQYKFSSTYTTCHWQLQTK